MLIVHPFISRKNNTPYQQFIIALDLNSNTVWYDIYVSVYNIESHNGLSHLSYWVSIPLQVACEITASHSGFEDYKHCDAFSIVLAGRYWSKNQYI